MKVLGGALDAVRRCEDPNYGRSRPLIFNLETRRNAKLARSFWCSLKVVCEFEMKWQGPDGRGRRLGPESTFELAHQGPDGREGPPGP